MAETSYEFQLPLEFGTEDAASGLGWWVKDQEGSVIVENDTRMRCEAICEAVNSHDQFKADNATLLDRLIPFAVLAKYEDLPVHDSVIMMTRRGGGKPTVNITSGDFKRVAQLYEKLKVE